METLAEGIGSAICSIDRTQKCCLFQVPNGLIPSTSVGHFLGHFHFTLTYRPRSQSVKPYTLSCQFLARSLWFTACSSLWPQLPGRWRRCGRHSGLIPVLNVLYSVGCSSRCNGVIPSSSSATQATSGPSNDSGVLQCPKTLNPFATCPVCA